MIRRFGAPPEPGRRYIRRLGAYALLPLGQSLLLTRQDADPAPELQLPGGGVDRGETPMVALHREVFEETGWSISAPRYVGAYRRFTYMPEYDLWAEKVCLIFRARPVRALSEPTEPGHTALWMAPDQAAGLLDSPGDRHFTSEHAQRYARIKAR
ncbi:MAG: NUDIX domain-containing protein [Paracoccaceae bacterium]